MKQENKISYNWMSGTSPNMTVFYLPFPCFFPLLSFPGSTGKSVREISGSSQNMTIRKNKPEHDSNKNRAEYNRMTRKTFPAALLITTALFSFDARAATEECVEAPSCTDLGYTRTADECPDGSVKCPWNTGLVFCECGKAYKYACEGDNETAGTDKCGNYYAACDCDDGYIWKNGACVSSRPSCNIGDIFYTDNTCAAAANHDSSKTVLGIVVHVNDNGVGGQIMAPWWIDASGNKTGSNSTTMAWGDYGTDILSLPNYTSRETASTDYDSCGNTDKIVAQGNAGTYPAAWAARKYAPTTDTAGKWCLPAAGIMTNIYNNQDAIQTAISKVGGVSYPSCCNWSSSEYSNTGAWGSYLGTSYGLDYYSKSSSSNPYVRPVLEF